MQSQFYCLNHPIPIKCIHRLWAHQRALCGNQWWDIIMVASILKLYFKWVWFFKKKLRKPLESEEIYWISLFILLTFQFQPDGYNPPRDGFRGRDNFGTLRSHQGDNYRRDGFSTTRSVKKVYLWDGLGATEQQPNMNQPNNLSNNLNNHHHSNNQQHSMNIISSNSEKSNNLSHHRSHHHHSNSNSSHGTNRSLNRMRRPPRQHHVHHSESPRHSSGTGSSPALSNSSSSSPAPQSSTPSPQESPKNCSYIYRDWLQFNTTPPSLMNNSFSPIVQFSGTANNTNASISSQKSATTKNNAKTLQPKKSSSSPLSKIKFHSISKRRMSNGQQKQLNINEKFQLIRKHGTSSSSFIGSDEYDYINYSGSVDNKSNCSGGKSSSLKKYFLKFAGDKVDSNNLESRNLFHLKRHHYPSTGASSNAKASTSDDNDFDVLDF